MHVVPQQSEPESIRPPEYTEAQIRRNANRFEIVRIVWIGLAVLLICGGFVTRLSGSNELVGATLFMGGFLLGLLCWMGYEGEQNEWLMLAPPDCTTLLELAGKVPSGEAYIKAVRTQSRPFIQLDLTNMRRSAGDWETWAEGAADRANCRRLYGLDDAEASVAMNKALAVEAGAGTNGARAAT